jgi:hypothetical protein
MKNIKKSCRTRLWSQSPSEAYIRVAVIDNEINAGMRDIYLAGGRASLRQFSVRRSSPNLKTVLWSLWIVKFSKKILGILIYFDYSRNFITFSEGSILGC